jgi:hypothetical protein
MAQEKIEVVYDTVTMQMLVGAPMNDQDQKERTIRMLLSAIKIVLDYKPSVIMPASSLPAGVIPFGNSPTDAQKRTN